MTKPNPKIIFCGSAGVGKTTIFRRILEREVDQSSSATMGAACATTHVVVNGQSVPLTLWDTAGQEEYRSLVNLYFRATAVAIIVFDLSDAHSFDAVRQWYRDLTSNCGDSDPDVILVGNKCDVREREVGDEQVDRFVGEVNCRYFEVSALEGTNIEALFRSMGTTAAHRLTKSVDEAMNEPPGNEQAKPGCC